MGVFPDTEGDRDLAYGDTGKSTQKLMFPDSFVGGVKNMSKFQNSQFYYVFYAIENVI